MKDIVGKVKSNKMDKTAVVVVDRKKQHPLYRKTLKVSKSYKADTSEVKVEIGDLVVIRHTRPVSKDKRWKVVEVLESKGEEDVAA